MENPTATPIPIVTPVPAPTPELAPMPRPAPLPTPLPTFCSPDRELRCNPSPYVVNSVQACSAYVDG